MNKLMMRVNIERTAQANSYIDTLTLHVDLNDAVRGVLVFTPHETIENQAKKVLENMGEQLIAVFSDRLKSEIKNYLEQAWK